MWVGGWRCRWKHIANVCRWKLKKVNLLGRENGFNSATSTIKGVVILAVQIKGMGSKSTQLSSTQTVVLECKRILPGQQFFLFMTEICLLIGGTFTASDSNYIVHLDLTVELMYVSATQRWLTSQFVTHTAGRRSECLITAPYTVHTCAISLSFTGTCSTSLVNFSVMVYVLLLCGIFGKVLIASYSTGLSCRRGPNVGFSLDIC